MYQLNLLEEPRKFLKKLKDRKLLLNLCHKIEELKYNPFPANSKKLKENLGYRIRIGDYRILYTVDKIVQVIEIYKIGHRKDVYR
ncbi:MAG: type II toxin-antitoxin system RelE/ParE family toxin [Candidatus Melainabacteria bacterium]|nr:type II toxin-antitoxin system RelE/ParE family toxin [Candidatus Melainabacteria bacterium]